MRTYSFNKILRFTASLMSLALLFTVPGVSLRAQTDAKKPSALAIVKDEGILR